MKILLLAVLITAGWTLLTTVFGRCGGRPVANSDSATRQRWFWDALDRNARFIGASSLPSSHPLARFRPSSS